jgi:hypothetical protein
MSKRLTRLAIAIAAGLALNIAAPVATPSFIGLTTAAHASQLDEFQTVLARYGSFQAHSRYGQIWVPAQTTVPQGWHPYAPCNWVHHKDLGWYYDDRSEWGRIVHHYGRWAHDASLGWVWVAGEEFSPGWVVWRTSEQYVGWAPMPPEQDVKTISAEQFNTDKHWIFMDAKKFGSRCQDGAGIAQAAQYPVILESTRLVTEIRFVRGIAVFVLPPPLIINIVDIDIGIFNPWSPCFFGAWFWNWNWVVNNIVVVINLPPAPAHPVMCNQHQPQKSLIMPIISNPPPAPGGTPPRNPDTPSGKPDGGRPDSGRPNGGNPDRNAGNDPRPINPGFVDPRTPRTPPQLVFPSNPGRPPVRIVDPIKPSTDNNPGGKQPGTRPNGSGQTPGGPGRDNHAGNSGGDKVSGSGKTRVPNRTINTPTMPDRVIRGAKSSSMQTSNVVQRTQTRSKIN